MSFTIMSDLNLNISKDKKCIAGTKIVYKIYIICNTNCNYYVYTFYFTSIKVLYNTYYFAL